MRGKVRKIGERVGGKGGERERDRREESKKACQSVRGWDEEGGSSDYRLSGVFYLWSKCTLAFLLSTPQMQLDSSLAKQTQMKWLLNDFLGNPPRQRKPSIWSLLFPSLPLLLLLLFLSLFSSPISPYFSLWFSVIFPVYSFCFAWFSFSFDLYCHIFSCLNSFFLYLLPYSLRTVDSLHLTSFICLLQLF